jgi:hypothetical protein
MAMIKSIQRLPMFISNHLMNLTRLLIGISSLIRVNLSSVWRKDPLGVLFILINPMSGYFLSKESRNMFLFRVLRLSQ